MKLSTLVLAVCALLFLGVSGCDSSKKEAVSAAPTPALAPQAQPDVVLGDAITGKIVETMNSGGYTYIRVENKGKKTWVAMPETKVKVGQQVTCSPGMEMKNFTSKTLKRTFASVIFSQGLL